MCHTLCQLNRLQSALNSRFTCLVRLVCFLRADLAWSEIRPGVFVVCFIASQPHATAVIRYTHAHTYTHRHKQSHIHTHTHTVTYTYTQTIPSDLGSALLHFWCVVGVLHPLHPFPGHQCHQTDVPSDVRPSRSTEGAAGRGRQAPSSHRPPLCARHGRGCGVCGRALQARTESLIKLRYCTGYSFLLVSNTNRQSAA